MLLLVPRQHFEKHILRQEHFTSHHSHLSINEFLRWLFTWDLSPKILEILFHEKRERGVKTGYGKVGAQHSEKPGISERQLKRTDYQSGNE